MDTSWIVPGHGYAPSWSAPTETAPSFQLYPALPTTASTAGKPSIHTLATLSLES